MVEALKFQTIFYGWIAELKVMESAWTCLERVKGNFFNFYLSLFN